MLEPHLTGSHLCTCVFRVQAARIGKKSSPLLHSAGADLEVKTYDKGIEGNRATALHGAAFYGYEKVSKLLLAADANPKLANKLGNYPISLAKSQGHKRKYTIY